MATEDKFIIKIDTSNSKMTVEQLTAKINKLYKGIATITASSSNAATGVRKYTAEVNKSKLAVNQLAAANAKLASSYKNTNSVTGKFIGGKQPVVKSQPAAGKFAEYGTFESSNRIYKDLSDKVTRGRGGRRGDALGGDLDQFSKTIKDKVDKTVSDIPAVGATIASRAIRRQSKRETELKALPNTPGAPRGIPAMGQYSVIPNPAGNWNQQNSNIDWVGDGDNRYKPAPTVAEKRRNAEQRASVGLVKRAKDLNRGFFQMQMSTLGVAFSFMTLQNTIVGIFTSLTDLPGALKGMALGKAFGGVDIAGSMGVDTGQIVEGWKRITGIMSMMQTVFVSFASLVLSPEVMTALAQFFESLGKSLADPKIVEALQKIVLAAIDFGYALLPLLPVLADLIIALSDAGLLKWLVGFVLMAGVLLSAMSLLGWGFQAVLLIVEALAPWIISVLIPTISGFFWALGIGVATLLVVIVGVLIIFDAVVKVIQEFWNEGISLQSLFNGLIKAFNDVYNVVVWVMNALSNLIGMGSMFKSNVPLDWLLGGNSGGTSTTSSTNINNTYVLNGTYSNGRDNIKMLNQTSNRSPT